jgi:steroid delta-isomerase-like uncharacterized protein
MSIQDNIKLNEAVFSAINSHDMAKYMTYFTDDAIVSDISNPTPMRGIEGIRMSLQPYLTSFPDLKIMVKNLIVSEDKVAGEIEFTGPNTGPMQMGPGTPMIPATGKKIDIKGTYFSIIRNGKIMELHSYPDVAGMMVQLGMMPMPAGK